MPEALAENASNTTNTATMNAAQLARLVESQAQKIAALEHQLDWFRRQIFGQKRERFAPEPDPAQLHLGQSLPMPTALVEARKNIPAHTRRVATIDAAESGEELPFFDESKVPVQTIVLMHADLEGVPADQYEIIGEKVTYRVAQRPGSFQVLKYRRPVVKLKATGQILCLLAPSNFLQGSRADVSFGAGLLIDKFAWHIPLYRQHQRLSSAGITVSRPWLTQLAQRIIALLAPIYEAQFTSIRDSRVKAMDETPIRAGRSGHGKMNTGYFWPVYGEQHEVCFPFHPSRAATVVRAALGLKHKACSVLLTDGYAAYARFAQQTGLTHAQCWAHARRTFFEALEAEPTDAAEALGLIKTLYEIEEQIRQRKFGGRGQATAPPHALKAAGRAILRVGRSAPGAARIHAEQPVHQSAELRARTTLGVGGLSHRSGCPDRHQSSGAGVTRNPDGPQILAILLDRAGRQTRRHHPVAHRHLQTARR